MDASSEVASRRAARVSEGGALSRRPERPAGADRTQSKTGAAPANAVIVREAMSLQRNLRNSRTGLCTNCADT